MTHSNDAGQSIIEVVVAVGLVVLVLTTLVSGLVLGIRNNRVAREQANAKDRVREGIEWFRALRDREGWTTFRALLEEDAQNPLIYCINSLPSTTEDFVLLNPGECLSNAFIDTTIFSREIEITLHSATEITAVVTVSWQDGRREQSSVSTIKFYQPI